jgi:hypothetical protein
MALVASGGWFTADLPGVGSKVAVKSITVCGAPEQVLLGPRKSATKQFNHRHIVAKT